MVIVNSKQEVVIVSRKYRMATQMEEMHAIRTLHGHSSAMGWNRPEQKLNFAPQPNGRSVCNILNTLKHAEESKNTITL